VLTAAAARGPHHASSPLRAASIVPSLPLRRRRPNAASKDFSIPLEGGGGGGGQGGGKDRGGGGGGGHGGGGGGGGGHDDAAENNSDPAAAAKAIAALLAAANRASSTLPADLAAALAAGRLTPEVLRRYLALESSAVQAWLLRFPGFRERLLADPGFLVKVAIECGIGVCTKVSAEYAKRGSEHFPKELDFVAANVLMAIIADFMLVWLPAPTLSLAGARAAAAAAAAGGGGASLASRLGAVFAGCPDNAFQCVQPGSPPFTLAQRLGAPVRNGLKLFGVGLGASFVGVAVTNALSALRGALDPSFAPLNPPQDVLAVSAAYGLYMATSSNLRYQFLAGVVEERGIERAFRGNAAACGVLSFVVRTGNTFLGSLLWVDFIRLLGMQKAGGGE